MSDGVHREHRWPDGESVWLPAVPEPLWVRTPLWRRLFLREPADRPWCCGQTFPDVAAYEDHYLTTDEPHEMGFVKRKR